MVNWYQFSALANIVLSAALLAAAILIAVLVLRVRRARGHRLAVATALLLFTLGVSRGLVATHYLVPGVSRTDSSVTFWWESAWSALTAAAAIYFLSLYRYLGQLLVGAPWLDRMIARGPQDQPAEQQADNASRKVAETERDTAAAMLRSIVANNQAAIYVKTLSGRYLLGNPKHAEIIGRPEADFLGLTDAIVDPGLAAVWGANDLRAQEGLYQVEETNDVFPDGRHYYESVKFPLYGSEGTVYATAGSSLDVTHIRRSRAEVEESRDLAIAASAAKSTFLATMSHEIRTPMNAVIGMTDLLLETELDEQQLEFVDTVRLSGDALLSVINDILDFSKIESGELRLERERFNLRYEVESCLDLVVAEATGKGLDLICYVEESCPAFVVGDATRLRQIVVNLLSNAVKFTSKGEILLTVAVQETAEGRLEVTATVTDTGIGIAPSGVARLFESFSQVDASTTRVYGGTGLGLVISQRLAEAMEGRVSVVSVPQVGSTFTVTLLLDPSPDGAPVPAPPTLVDLTGLAVLVVDDNLTCLRVLGLQLTSLGMRCTTVATPAEALELVRGGLHYDVAVVDMLMPRLNGVQLATELREIPRVAQAPIVLVTSVGTRPPGAEGMFAALLAKPVKGTSLLRALSAALTGGPAVDVGERSHPFARAAVPLRILLAEDNPVNQRVAQLMLDKLGHSVHTVGNGLAAVAAIRAKPYDVILMDVQMPELDGLDATRRIREEIPLSQQPYIIAVTASALVEDRDACASAGMESYLTKPIRALDLKNVLTEVAELLRHGQPEAEAGGGTTEEQPEPVAPPAAGPPAVDEQVLEHLVHQLDDQDGELLRELIDSYLGDSAEQLPELVRGCEAVDATRVLKIAHSLRSSSGLLGAVHLVELLQEAEQAARGTAADLPAIALRVRVEHARVRAALLEVRDRPLQLID